MPSLKNTAFIFPEIFFIQYANPMTISLKKFAYHKTVNISNTKIDFQKGKLNSFFFFRKAFQISSNYFSFYRHSNDAFHYTLVRSVKMPEITLISESEVSQLLTINPFVIGTRILKTKIRAFNFVVHLIGEEGVHKTLPTLKIREEIKINFVT